ncbi:MAG TPA: 3-hydroxyacyl-CoA dehydrogenase NAD-binding domain-containing protein [Bacilli bacterium]|nr:3-hydroxyacyl-CoA dehydrogenase NAD-binding domain-containing protein [Bacilli bacterium]
MKSKRVGLIGAGTMGCGLAEAMAAKGFDIALVGRTPEDLQRAEAHLERVLTRRLQKWSLTEAEKKAILSRIRLTVDWGELKACGLVIEAIWERLPDKIAVHRQIEQVVGAEVPIASNTSTLSITEIAAQLQHPERLLGLHFHYPPDRRELVELVRGEQTSDETVATGRAFIESLEMTAVHVFESPGYVTTRLMLPLINEAIALLTEGVATAEDIDTAMEVGYGFHSGPLTLADRFGLDSVLKTMEALFSETGDPRYRPTPLLRQKVRMGQLGVKTGEGIFRYDEGGNRLS